MQSEFYNGLDHGSGTFVNQHASVLPILGDLTHKLASPDLKAIHFICSNMLLLRCKHYENKLYYFKGPNLSQQMQTDSELN